MSTDYDPTRPPWSTARRPARDGDLRVSDAERQRVAEALSQHYSDGRLNDTELHERLDAAMGAKTRDDLAPLLVDLPRLGGPEPEPRPRRFTHLVFLAALLLLTLSAATAFVRPHVPWLLIGLLVFFIARRRGYRGHHRYDSNQTIVERRPWRYR